LGLTREDDIQEKQQNFVASSAASNDFRCPHHLDQTLGCVTIITTAHRPHERWPTRHHHELP